MVGATLAVLILLIAVPGYKEGGTLSGTEICLDPGHGGSDPGAVYDDGTIYLEEADINLDVAFGLKALLEVDGAQVVMFRTGDTYGTNNDRYTFCNGAQATILISIHTNSYTNSDWDGSLVLYFKKEDRPLAQTIYDVMYPTLRDSAPAEVTFTGFGLNRFASGVLLKSDMPAAIMEPVFMSNPAEAEWLTTTLHAVDGQGVVELDAVGNPTTNGDCSNCRRAQIADAIHEGIVAYFGGSDPTSTPEPAGTMHVDNIDMTLEQKAVWTHATATVTVVDEFEVVVEGVAVSGTWSDATGDSDFGITGTDGTVVLESDVVKKASGTTFTFKVDDVVLYGWKYNSGANVETSDSIPIP